MKHYLLPVVLCFFWATPIQVSAAEVCPQGPIIPACETHLKSTLPNGNKVLECLREFQDKPVKGGCKAVLQEALDSFPKAYEPGKDTSATVYIYNALQKE